MKIIKKHKKLLIFIAVCLSIFFIYQKNNQKNINYTSLGDGFALGENSYGEINYGYSDYIKDYLMENNKLNNYVKDFSTKTMSIETLYENIVTNKKIKLKNKEINIKQTLRESTIVTLSVGLNDLIYRLSLIENPTDSQLDHIISEIDSSFKELITEMNKYHPHKIYVIGYYNVKPNNYYLKEGIKKLNKIYSSNKNIIYIPTYELFENNSAYRSNASNIHPNSFGYRAIYQEIMPKISKKLEKR